MGTKKNEKTPQTLSETWESNPIVVPYMYLFHTVFYVEVTYPQSITKLSKSLSA